MGRTIDKIIDKVDTRRGAPMGRVSYGERPTDKKIFDCAVPLIGDGAYDKGGAYWGIGAQLRVSYTQDLSYVQFYRRGDEPPHTCVEEKHFNGIAYRCTICRRPML